MREVADDPRAEWRFCPVCGGAYEPGAPARAAGKVIICQCGASHVDIGGWMRSSNEYRLRAELAESECDALKARVAELEGAIRKHRSILRNDPLVPYDEDYELWDALGEIASDDAHSNEEG